MLACCAPLGAQRKCLQLRIRSRKQTYARSLLGNGVAFIRSRCKRDGAVHCEPWPFRLATNRGHLSDGYVQLRFFSGPVLHRQALSFCLARYCANGWGSKQSLGSARRFCIGASLRFGEQNSRADHHTLFCFELRGHWRVRFDIATLVGRCMFLL